MNSTPTPAPAPVSAAPQPQEVCVLAAMVRQSVQAGQQRVLLALRAQGLL